MQPCNRDLIQNRSRRKFFTTLKGGMLTLMSALYFTSCPKESTDQEEFIIVNGWVLKKKDLDVI